VPTRSPSLPVLVAIASALSARTAPSDQRGLGTYTCAAPSQPRPHAVTTISGGTINTTFTWPVLGSAKPGPGEHKAT
jgi:hypothetical protein